MSESESKSSEESNSEIDGTPISDRIKMMQSADVESLRARASPIAPSATSNLEHVETIKPGKVSIEREGKDSLVHFDMGQAIGFDAFEKSGVKEKFLNDKQIAAAEQTNERDRVLLDDASLAVAINLLQAEEQRQTAAATATSSNVVSTTSVVVVASSSSTSSSVPHRRHKQKKGAKKAENDEELAKRLQAEEDAKLASAVSDGLVVVEQQQQQQKQQQQQQQQIAQRSSSASSSNSNSTTSATTSSAEAPASSQKPTTTELTTPETIRLLKTMEDENLISKAVRQFYTQKILDKDVAVCGLIDVFKDDRRQLAEELQFYSAAHQKSDSPTTPVHTTTTTTTTTTSTTASTTSTGSKTNKSTSTGSKVNKKDNKNANTDDDDNDKEPLLPKRQQSTDKARRSHASAEEERIKLQQTRQLAEKKHAKKDAFYEKNSKTDIELVEMPSSTSTNNATTSNNNNNNNNGSSRNVATTTTTTERSKSRKKSTTNADGTTKQRRRSKGTEGISKPRKSRVDPQYLEMRSMVMQSAFGGNVPRNAAFEARLLKIKDDL